MMQLVNVLFLGLLTAVAVGAPASGGSPAFALFAALLPAAFLQIVALRRADALPDIAVLFSGLAADFVSGGIFGFFTFINALAWCLGLVLAPYGLSALMPGRLGLFAAVGAVILCAGIAVGWLVGVPLARTGDALWAWLYLIAVYPVLAAAAGLTLRWSLVAAEERLEV